jgi:ABC-type xylose transport system permease subunit
MSLVGNALTMLDVSLYWHQVVTGAILATAVSTDTIIHKRRV